MHDRAANSTRLIPELNPGFLQVRARFASLVLQPDPETAQVRRHQDGQDGHHHLPLEGTLRPPNLRMYVETLTRQARDEKISYGALILKRSMVLSF